MFGPSIGLADVVGEERSNKTLWVLTRNVYIGADIDPIFAVDFRNPMAVVEAATVWANVQSTRFDERAAALVDEIERRQPHLIGLQEVAQFVTIDPTSGPTGSLDFLAMLDQEILSRGLRYDIVQVQENTRATLPVAVDLETGAITEVVRFTDRDVVLARSDVRITGADSANYQADFQVGPVTLKRGWIRVEAHYQDHAYTFVNTHLETQSIASVQAAQLQELLASVLSGLHGVTILAGDLNSDAEGHPGDPSWTPTYHELIARGFVDTWHQAHRSRPRPGFTCCHDKDLLNVQSDFDERIDFILVRDDHDSSHRRIVEAVRAEIVGGEIGDLTLQHGLWPSDHGGLISQLRIRSRSLADDD